MTSSSRKKPGPKSWPGQRISSKNALTHGATSKDLVSQAEVDRFTSLCRKLRKQYPQKNILIEEQIKRLSRLFVLLERIQTIIDTSFEMRRANSNVLEELTDSLKMSPAEKSLTAKMTWGITDTALIEEVDNTVANQVIQLTLQTGNLGVDDLIKIAPDFSHYLHETSQQLGLPINQYIESILKQKPNLFMSDNELSAFLISLRKKLHKTDEKTLEMAMAEVDLALLNQLIHYWAGHFFRLLMTQSRIQDFKRLQATYTHSALPDMDQLDRLMRYQTSLQNQVSRCMGELLELIKNIN